MHVKLGYPAMPGTGLDVFGGQFREYQLTRSLGRWVHQKALAPEEPLAAVAVARQARSEQQATCLDWGALEGAMDRLPFRARSF